MFFLSIFMILVQTQAYHWSGNVLYDLEFKGNRNFNKEAESWSWSGSSNQNFVKTSQCSSDMIVGGFQIVSGRGNYWYRTYSSLPDHNTIFIKIRIFAIDTWDGAPEDDHLEMGYDLLPSFRLWTIRAFESSYALSNICGRSDDDGNDLTPITVYLTIPHSSNTLLFKIYYFLNGNPWDESLGFRDISMTFSTLPSPPSSVSFCGVTAAPAWPLDNNACSCGSGTSMALANSGLCSSCHADCKTCSGSGSSACTSCIDGKYLSNGECKSCNSPCASCNGGADWCLTCQTDYYYQTGGYCAQSCNSPLTPVSIDGQRYCEVSCPAGQYIYWDGSCVSTCDYPLNIVKGTDLYCRFPCSGSLYSYWNGSCLNDCPSPLVKAPQYGKNFCKFPCQDTEFLYWNGTCKSSCPSPLSQEIQQGTSSSRNFCWYKCQPNQYLYWNGSCINICPAPLVSEAQQDRNFCLFPCQEDEFLYWNGTCKSTCPLPLRSEVLNTSPIRKHCWFPCQPTQYLYWNGSCINTCPAPLVSEAQQDRNFCWYPCQQAEYLYWDGFCHNSCPSPLTSETQGTFPRQKFCWPSCELNDYLYWNGSCINTCPSPLMPVTSSNLKSCEYPCDPSKHLYWNGSCIDTCPSPLISEVQGTFQSRSFCWYPCPESKFLYWNGSCLDTCPSPLTPETQSSNRKFCWYTCQPNQYLYWNGSCIDSCDWPLIQETQGTRNFCWPVCQANQFTYWNRSCLSTCPLPLVQKIEPQAKFCIYPCQNPTDYLYSNQSCLSSCLYPLTTIINPGAQYCFNPCGTSGSFLYENKSCIAGCSSPFLRRQEPDINYCDKPCFLPNIYWYKNTSCLPECNFPYIQVNYSGILQCLPPCKEKEYFYEFEKQCFAKCETPFTAAMKDVIKVCQIGIPISLSDVTDIQGASASIAAQGQMASGGMKAASAMNSNSPSSALLAGLSSMMQYIRYMKINYPPKVQMLFMVSAGSPISFSFGIDMPAFIENKLIDAPLPDAFDKYDINSNFVSNMWNFLMSLSLLLLVVIGLTLLKLATSKCPRINAIVARVLQTVKWNFVIMIICSSSGDIFFFGSLQIKGSPFKSLSSAICCILSLLMMVVVVGVLTIAFKIVQDLRKCGQNPQNAQKWKGFEILYIEYEDKSTFSLAYMFLFLSRGIIFNLTLANLYNFPMAQCIIMNICNGMMLIYIIYLRPLKDLLNLIQLIINEGLINILSVSVLILGIFDAMGSGKQGSRANVGDAILFVIKVFNTCGLAFMALGLLIFLISMFRIWKRLRAQGFKSPFQMLKAMVSDPSILENDKTIADDKTVVSDTRDKKPKILRPPRRDKRLEFDQNNRVIFFESDSINTTNHMITLNNPCLPQNTCMQTEFKEEQGSELQLNRDMEVTDLDISRVCSQQKDEELFFQGLVINEQNMKDQVENVVVEPHKEEEILEANEEVEQEPEINPEPRNRVGSLANIEDRLDNFNKRLRALKMDLIRDSHYVGLNLGNKKNS